MTNFKETLRPLVCHCSLAGTAACEKCNLYKQHIGEPDHATTDGMPHASGWVCPICKTVYAPNVMSCWVCKEISK